MPRIPVHTTATAPEGSVALMEKLQQKHGKLLNIHAEMADSSAVIAAYDAIATAIATHGTLDALTREAAWSTGSVSAEAWNNALAAGWTRAELSETFVHLAINIYTNFFNHYAETELDIRHAPQLPDRPAH